MTRGYVVQELLPAALRRTLPRTYETENVDLDDKIVVVKFFNPYGVGTWYAVEFDGEDTFFGVVDLGMTDEPEWGYFSLAELTALRARVLGRPMPFQGVERDEHWTPKPWREVVGGGTCKHSYCTEWTRDASGFCAGHRAFRGSAA